MKLDCRTDQLEFPAELPLRGSRMIRCDCSESMMKTSRYLRVAIGLYWIRAFEEVLGFDSSTRGDIQTEQFSNRI